MLCKWCKVQSGGGNGMCQFSLIETRHCCQGKGINMGVGWAGNRGHRDGVSAERRSVLTFGGVPCCRFCTVPDRTGCAYLKASLYPTSTLPAILPSLNEKKKVCLIH